jgi:HK97 family phage prohead protease
MKSKPDRETRAFKTIELRADADGPKIVGHAAVFNRLSEDLGGFREVVMPTAFERALSGKDDVRALVGHDGDKILGRLPKTLQLEKDDVGLGVTIYPPNTTTGNDIVTSIGRGDIDSMSFGFRTIDDHWETHDGEEVRYLDSVELFDVSTVTYPAYINTDVAVRSLKKRRSSEWTPGPKIRAVMAWLENDAPQRQRRR